MDDLRTWIARADAAAARFLPHAARHDREAGFPAENVEWLRSEGWLGVAAAPEHGGAGASLHDCAVLLERIARGDPGTALGLTMHVIVLGVSARAPDRWPAPLFGGLARGAVAGDVVAGALASEAELGSPARGGVPATTAIAVEDGWRVTGRKTWSTWLPALTHAVVSARLERPGETSRLGQLMVRLDSPGVMREPAPPGVGMRSAANGTLVLEDVEVPGFGLFGEHAVGERDPRGPLQAAWFAVLTSAVYLGAAHAARDAVTAYARERRPNGRDQPISEIPAVRLRLGRIDAAVRASRLLLLGIARGIDATVAGDGDGAVGALLGDIGTAKVHATQLAWQACEDALRLAGGPALLGTDLPLERLWRDVRGGLVHPPIEDVLHGGLGEALATGGGGDGAAAV